MLPNFVNDPSSRTLRREEGGKEGRSVVSFCPLSTFHSLSIQDPVLRIVLTRSFPRCCLLSRYRTGIEIIEEGVGRINTSLPKILKGWKRGNLILSTLIFFFFPFP